MAPHKSGFINILGKPNVGKSTLMNALVGERMSIITHKPQTTRHRILGILNADHFQLVFSDTPGLISDSSYKMHNAMNKAAFSIFEDADVVLFVTEKNDQYTGKEKVIKKLRQAEVPVLLVINKTDISSSEEISAIKDFWVPLVSFHSVHCISALQKKGTEALLDTILNLTPEGPVYFPKDQISDRPERFFVSEIIREKVLFLYKDEIPYSTEVVIEAFTESVKKGAPFAHISATLYVMRRSQKQILIGRQGGAIKKLGIESRKAIEEFLGKRIHLELYVRVKEKWRDDDRMLKSFGYLH